MSDDQDQHPNVPDGWEVIQGGKSSPPAAAVPSVGARAGVPAAGRGTQLDLAKSQRGLDVATTPLAHPTGIDAIDSFTSPVGLASLAAGGAGVLRAGVTEGAGAAAGAAAAQASPIVKYELVRTALTHLGVHPTIAMAAAALASGYKGKGAKVVPAEAADAVPAIVETPQARMAREVAQPAARPPIAAPAPASSAAAHVSASPQPVAPPPLDTAGQPAITAQPPVVDARTTGQIANAVDRAIGQAKVRGQVSPDEFKALFTAVKAGKPAETAVAELLAARAPALTPAEQLAQLPGMMSDAEVQAALDARQVKGAKSVRAPVLTPARMAELQAKFGGTGR